MRPRRPGRLSIRSTPRRGAGQADRSPAAARAGDA